MPYDLVIKNGSIVDGSGAPAFHADVGITGGKIALIGRIREDGAETIDAEGHIVSPGFIDGHTHMDAQVFWDRIGSSSCYHGVTSVVMGNCGFTLAPCPEEHQDLAIRNLERAEDIARESMQEGINWTWETYPDYLDAVEAVPKASTMLATSATRRFAPMSWANARSPSRRRKTNSPPCAGSCRKPSAPARSGSRPRARIACIPTGRWRARSPTGARFARSSTPWAKPAPACSRLPATSPWGIPRGPATTMTASGNSASSPACR